MKRGASIARIWISCGGALLAVACSASTPPGAGGLETKSSSLASSAKVQLRLRSVTVGDVSTSTAGTARSMNLDLNVGGSTGDLTFMQCGAAVDDPCTAGKTWYFPADVGGADGPCPPTGAPAGSLCTRSSIVLMRPNWVRLREFDTTTAANSVELGFTISQFGPDFAGSPLTFSLHMDLATGVLTKGTGAPSTGVASFDTECVTNVNNWKICWDVSHSSAALLDPSRRVMPTTIDAANAELNARKRSLIASWVRNYATASSGRSARALPDWEESAQTALRFVAAGAAVFGRPELWAGQPAAEVPQYADLRAILSGLAANAAPEAHLAAWQANVEPVLSGIGQTRDVGTDEDSKLCDSHGTCGDYDFVLVDAIALVYAFREAQVAGQPVLSKAIVRRLITQGAVTFAESGDTCAWQGGQLPFSGQFNPANLADTVNWVMVGPSGRYYFRQTGNEPTVGPLPDMRWVIKASTAETENHLLGMYAWRYLAQRYLEWVASPAGQSSPRRDACLKDLFDKNGARYANGPALNDFMFQMLGRFLFFGGFETNAKPYEAYALTPLLALASHAGVPTTGDAARDQVAANVRTAATNAVNYLATEFALQSFEGKRVAPMRRNYGNRTNMHPHMNDYVGNMFGVLTGAYVFDDRTTLLPGEACGTVLGQRSCDPRPYLDQRIGQAGGFALWAALSSYQVPAAIHGWMLDKQTGYWARLQSRYSRSHYPLHQNLLVGYLGEPDDPAPAPPRYLPDRAAEQATPFAPVTQYYFGAPTFVNSAGGRHVGYYPAQCVSEISAELVVACEVALPGICDVIMLAVGPFCGDHEKLHSYDAVARPYTIIGRGNIYPYNPLHAGLSENTAIMTGTSDAWDANNLATYKSFSYGYDSVQSNVFPQRYPFAWNTFRGSDEPVSGSATFRFFDFTGAGAVSANHTLRDNYLVMAKIDSSGPPARGFWEVVPATRFVNVQALRDATMAANPPSHFPATGNVQYTMATGETLTLDRWLAGANIVDIHAADGSLIPPGTFRVDKLLERDVPLIQAWPVDAQYRFIPDQDPVAFAPGDGTLVVRNLRLNQNLVINSSDLSHPTSVVTSNRCNPDAPFDAYIPAFTGNADVDGLSFSADRRTAYLSGKNAVGDYDIFIATRPSIAAAFDPLASLTSVNTPANARAPSIAADGVHLYMTTRVNGWDDIGVSTWSSATGSFGTPSPVPGINSNVHDQDPFWWGADTLYFASERPDGAHRDLYVTKLSSGGFSQPTKLNVVNSPYEDFRPVLTADGLTLYFSSKRPGIGTDGDGDVLMAKRASIEADFGEPVNLAAFNTSGSDFPVAVSSDGCTLTFASNRETGLGGTDSFRLYQATRAATIPSAVTLRLNIVGDGSVVSGPFNCSTGNVGTCSASAPPDSQATVWASRHAAWSGTCAPNGAPILSTDGIVVFTRNGVCTVTFPPAQ
jgi:hypothetical protein